MKKPPILIVGAGPTGLTLANLLAMAGTPFVIIDKAPQPSRSSKAFGIHARTLEIFEQIGVVEKAIKQGSIDNNVHLLIKKKEAVNINFKEMLPGETRYPHLLILEQFKTEQILIETLEEKGHHVLWEHELMALTEINDAVEVAVSSNNSESTSIFNYVIGCDGASSTVRAQGGFEFQGKTIEDTFYLADGELEWEHPHSDNYFILAPLYFSAIFSFSEKNRYRIFNFLNTAVDKGEEEELTAKDVQKILDSNPYQKVKAKNMDWFSIFKVHTRFTKTFSRGRLFLAGDAGHVHSPAGAQGMNTGIQDAYNLTWKLSLVVNKKAGAKLLETYNEERHRIAENLHKTTDRFFRLLIQQNPFANFLRLYVLPQAMRLNLSIDWLLKRNLSRFSQLSIKYRFSSLNTDGSANGFHNNAPKPGDRAPYCTFTHKGIETDCHHFLSYSYFTVIIVVAISDEALLCRVRDAVEKEVSIPIRFHCLAKTSASTFFKRYGVKKDAVFIIRPDGHIAFRSSRIDGVEIRKYFQNKIGAGMTEHLVQEELAADI